MNLHRIAAIIDQIVDFFFLLGKVILIVVWGIVCADVVMRYLFNSPIAWSVEVTEYGLVLITFLGAPWLLKKKKHTNIDIVVIYLTPKTQRALNTITHLVGAIICMSISLYSAQATWDMLQRHVLLTKALEIPKAYLFITIPLGTFLLSIQFLREAYEYLRGSAQD
jgi:TRAP-type C4-dicarboxylate transport system permease small subunit